MDSLETELDRARELDVSELADAIETIGFECTRCGACCKSEDGGCGGNEDGDTGDPEPHTATVFPEEIRELQRAGDYDFRDVARPMPYGIEETPEGPQGETFEWALQTDSCGDCTFYDETDGMGACTVHEDRPLICRTYPFSVALGGTSQPMGEAVDSAGMVRAHECEGLGRDISRADAEELAAALKERAVRELEEAIGVRENYEPTDAEGVVVHDSEGQKRPDGSELT
jgi:Fe-S-cluster containining protein